MSWRRLLLSAAVLDGLLLAVVGLTKIDRETIAFAVFFLVLSGVLGRGWPGTRIVAPSLLGVLFADVSFWMVTAAITNIGAHAPLLAILEPTVLACVSLAGLIAAAASLVRRRDPAAGRRPAVAVAATAIVALVLVSIVGVLSASTGQAAAAGDVVVRIHNAAFSGKTLTARAGSVTLDVTNDDLFWHTLTIDQLHIDVVLPVGGHQRVSFQAPSGTYTFYCRVPGHRQAGMVGTVTIS